MDADAFARKRIARLLELARTALREDEELSLRYVELARKLAKRHRLKLGSMLFCRKCGVVFVLGETLKVRVSRGAPVFVCLKCGASRRVSGKPKQF
ncbi:MAG: ribonuclease P protein component 4 [Candidatus Micrarchaeia archaeon]|jgi:ribonuclease P protein subunit RPR2